jgi:hypothetical protein
MNQNIDDVMRRTYRYYYEDGLVETAVGILFFIIGLALLGWLTIQSNPALGIGMVFLSVLLILGSTLFIKKAIPSLKERFTHPRTGYVTYRHGEPTWGRWPVMLAALMLAILSLLFPEYLSQMSIMEGALLGIILCYMGYRVSLRRFYLLGAAALLIGLAATLWLRDDITGSAFTFGGTGAIMLISGLIILRRYLRSHPISGDDYE